MRQADLPSASSLSLFLFLSLSQRGSCCLFSAPLPFLSLSVCLSFSPPPLSLVCICEYLLKSVRPFKCYCFRHTQSQCFEYPRLSDAYTGHKLSYPLSSQTSSLPLTLHRFFYVLLELCSEVAPFLAALTEFLFP